MSSDPKDSASSTARWLNRVTTMVLAASAGVLGVVAAPSLLRAAAGVASDAHEMAPPVRAQNPSIVPGVHHAFEPPEERDDADPPRLPTPPRGLHPNDPRVRAPRFPGDRSGDSDPDDDAAPGIDDLGLKGGVMKKPLALRDRRTNAVIQELRAGDKVHVLREDGDWILVVKDGANLVTGWAKKSELSLR